MNEPMAERECPDQTQAGWASSEFADLYAEHSRAIFYLALRFLSDPQKAEDATHDVFLKAFRKMDQFRGEASWRTWLYRIAINHCRNLQQSWNERHMFSNADEAVWENAVAQSDSVSTELTGTRTATRNGNQDFVSCDLPSGSDAAANRQTALSVSFKATAAGSGSDVRITSRVITTYPGYEGTSMQVPPNADNCVSNGTIEQQLANALR